MYRSPRWFRRRRGRPPKPRFLGRWESPLDIIYIPYPLGEAPRHPIEPVVLEPDEVEAFRLVYLDGLTQGDAALRMGISRGTLWRILDSARRKIALAIVNGRPLIVKAPS